METPRRKQRNAHAKSVQLLSTPLQIPPSPFMKNIGYGTGVNVYRLERSPKCGEIRSPWAVKKVSQRARENGSEIFNERMQEEAEILRKLSHPNIVGFRGVAKANDGTVDSLALECCETSLASILEIRFETDLGPLPAQHTVKMIEDIARALDYLHTEAYLLHGDMKSGNVLVKGDFKVCKLCDFGVSLPMDKDGLIDFVKNPKLRYVGTNVWSAPEILDEAAVIDCKADIFSFGLVIYETIALVPPHTLDIVDVSDAPENENVKNLSENDTMSSEECDILAQDLACGTRPPLPQAFELSDAYKIILELFYICTNELAEDRPSAKAIWQNIAKSTTSEECA